MPSTRSKTRDATAPLCHTEHFFYDDEDSSALTVLVHAVRFHIMVDYSEIKDSEVGDQYLQLLKRVKRKDAAEQGETVQSPSRKRKRGADDSKEYPEDEEQTDSGYGSSPPGRQESEEQDTEEAGITQSGTVLAENDQEDDVSRRLHNWILEPMGKIFADEAPADTQQPKTVYDWYHNPTHFYTLSVTTGGSLVPTKEDLTSDLESRITMIIPSLHLPKYIHNLKIPHVSTSSLEILDTMSTPSPLHASTVRNTLDGKTYFLKIVDPSQPGPTKRELKLMKQIERAGLHKKMRVPLVHALVIDDSAKTLPSTTTSAPILGFLQTHIASPTPLTQMLDTDVAEDSRLTWARDSERMVAELHGAGLVWGDAKADNFMVDEDANLWIIDFGGSYTEGWVDAELNETLEGDDMGVKKVKLALEDPEGFTFDPEAEEVEDE